MTQKTKNRIGLILVAALVITIMFLHQKSKAPDKIVVTIQEHDIVLNKTPLRSLLDDDFTCSSAKEKVYASLNKYVVAGTVKVAKNRYPFSVTLLAKSGSGNYQNLEDTTIAKVHYTFYNSDKNTVYPDVQINGNTIGYNSTMSEIKTIFRPFGLVAESDSHLSFKNEQYDLYFHFDDSGKLKNMIVGITFPEIIFALG